MTPGVLVDTSVWVNHFRGLPSQQAAELAFWLDEDPDRVLLNEVVVTELLRGVRDDAEAARMRALLEKLPQADPLQRDDWLASARIYRTCRQAGLTIRSPMDCLIAAHAMRLRSPVLAIDRDFSAIASCLPLALHHALPQ